MPFQVIIVIIFFAFVFIFAVITRNSTLEKLIALPGEDTLFEDKYVTVKQKGSPQQTNLVNCIVRVTNQRIIIAQKVALKKASHVLRHVITYNTFKQESIGLASSLKKGYLIFEINKSQITFWPQENEDLIKIHLPESRLTSGQYIEYATQYFDEYKKTFK